ncbi:hypothetical protein [Streptomyces sp. NPDC046939]|uniref:hypothetical protein n=1 Tax=Streptomyces sp. NPDC046939 TaxID=3155376 RepID=UPI0033E629AF
MAIGTEPRGAVRLYVEWTPGVNGVQVAVKHPGTLEEYAAYRAERHAIMPYVPDAATLNSALRGILGSAKTPCRRALYAYAVACRNGFTWLPAGLS